MNEAEWLACQSLVEVADDLLPGLSYRKFLLFLSASFRFVMPNNPCLICRPMSDALQEEKFDELSAFWKKNLEKVGYRCCDYRNIWFHIFYLLEGYITIRECWNKVIDVSSRVNDERNMAIMRSWSCPPAEIASRLKLLGSQRQETYYSAIQPLRDIMGNPYRSMIIDPDWLAWNGRTVSKLAEAIYEEDAFERLPILGDALEDAGCADEEILSHCRSDGPHWRGCWLIDRLLGKE